MDNNRLPIKVLEIFSGLNLAGAFFGVIGFIFSLISSEVEASQKWFILGFTLLGVLDWALFSVLAIATECLLDIRAALWDQAKMKATAKPSAPASGTIEKAEGKLE
jgi:mannose/fructose/N-acetylgalactosamine-specific phosphotransferase system component IIC